MKGMKLQMENSNQRKAGAILSYVSILVSMLIQLLYTPYLVRMLGQSEYGLYSLISSIIGYLTILDLGFGNAIVVYTSKYIAQKKYDEEQKLHGMFSVVFTILGIIAAILGLILFFNIDNIFRNTMSIKEIQKAKIMMLILTFNLAITFPFSIYSSIISAYEKFTFQKIMAILNSLLKPLLMIPLLSLGYKSITMSLVITIVNIIVLFSNYLFCRKKLKIKIKFSGIDKILFKTILRYSIWLFLTEIVDKVNWSVDQFILGIVCGTTQVSIYSLATLFNTLFISLSTAISSIFLPKMSKMISTNASNNELTDEFIKVGRIQFYIMFLVTTGFILFGKDFFILWVGKKYVTSYYVTLCLVVPAFFSLIQNVGLSIMQAKNKYKFKAILTSCMAIFNILISIFLAKKLGAIGAALGTTFVILLCNTFIINIYYYKVIKLDVIKFWKIIGKMAINYIFPMLVVLIFVHLAKFSELGKILIFGTIYTILFILITYFINMNNYEKKMVKSFYKKILRR